VTAFYQEMGAKSAERLQQTAVAADPDWQADTPEPDGRACLALHQCGITTVLVGMRHPAYVQDILADFHNPV
jgi:hypothetical protein